MLAMLYIYIYICQVAEPKFVYIYIYLFMRSASEVTWADTPLKTSHERNPPLWFKHISRTHSYVECIYYIYTMYDGTWQCVWSLKDMAQHFFTHFGPGFGLYHSLNSCLFWPPLFFLYPHLISKISRFDFGGLLLAFATAPSTMSSSHSASSSWRGISWSAPGACSSPGTCSSSSGGSWLGFEVEELLKPSPSGSWGSWASCKEGPTNNRSSPVPLSRNHISSSDRWSLHMILSFMAMVLHLFTIAKQIWHLTSDTMADPRSVQIVSRTSVHKYTLFQAAAFHAVFHPTKLAFGIFLACYVSFHWEKHLRHASRHGPLRT